MAYTLAQDAVWFITGCSSGIGQTLCNYLANNTSNRIVATARNPSSLSSIPSTANVLKLALDVTSKSSIQAAIKAALEKFGRIDVFVNNAGYALTGDTENADDAEARRVLDTNFWGAVDITKAALPILRDENPKTGQQGGVIVQITSMGGRLAFPGNAFYHSSKFALEGFTESVAKEMDPAWNIHFSLIEPGGVKTSYATSSMKTIAPHPAYAAPTMPSRVLQAYGRSAEAMKNFAEPEKVVEEIVRAVKDGVEGANGGKGGIPFRLPLGSDSWGMQKLAVQKNIEELDALKDVSVSTSGAKQLESIAFLQKDLKV